ncbi:uncharacterized protein LOC111396653 [Olea europaea var. sylvestris]|uniref:uncharacterized protein LOC111396653 n=1 Tax=Olea europaea var. sylvestris TaxID=158386 RepID=UPI000C1CF40F|nr:uncharacterized protein LOC111396653 [Olea europaea var. sylvestris]
MKSSSVNLYFRKRKKQSPSLPHRSVGIFTRSKSQVYVHRNRSGRTRLDVSRKSNFHSCSISSNPFPGKPKSVQPGSRKETGTEPVEAYLRLNDEISCRISSIKDLRTHRVFSSAVSPILEEEEGKINGNSKLLQNMGLDTDSDRCMDLDARDKELEENRQSVETMPSDAVAKENDSKNGLNLMKDKATSTNGSVSTSRKVLNSCAKRKVFKTPNSFNYRRLLPYLMDVVKEKSSASEIEIVGVEFPNKLQELSGLSPKMPSFMDNGCAAKLECVGARTNPTDSFKDEKIQKLNKEQPSILQNLIGVEYQLEHRSYENGVSGVEDSVEEECISMKHDSDVLHATASRDSGRNMEVNTLLTEKPNIKGTSVGCLSIGNKSRHSANVKSGTNWLSETFLTPCSQVRVFKVPSSASYRRLLPYLIDVAKQNSCDSKVIRHPKPQIDSPDVHLLSYATSDEGNPVKKIRMESFCEQPHTEDEEQNLLLALVPGDNVSSSDTDNSLSPSTPPLYSTNHSSKVGPSSIISDDTTDLVMPLDLPKEGRLLIQNSPKKSESDIFHNDIMDCNGKSNCSVVESFSIVDHDIQTDTKRNCIAVNVEAYKSNELIEKVTSNQGQSQIEVSDTLISHTDVPFKGILKKNPKGCRGPCNCLNCASFRLHAERAFEFSRNQLLDAEEVAWNLMKELANVCHILEMSAVNENDLTTIQLNQTQVNQACNKALETENLAKESLRKLNYDLNIHCRTPALQRPRVTFANYIQERVIPKTDASTGPETPDKWLNKENT